MISVIYCTREENPQHKEHIRKTSGMAKKIEVIEIINNGESLTKAYNRGLKMATNDVVVFCHDDIIFEKNGWATKLLNHFEDSDYGILGIAGTTDLDETGRWWNDRTKMVGAVKHTQNGKTWENKYSGVFPKQIIETVIVDGLFFAIDKTRIKKEFDESVEGFHFYEIDFCFRNHLKGVKVGVNFDVKVIHKSVGQTNDQWEENREIFAEKYKENLPLKLEVNPPVINRLSKLKTEPKVKILVHSNGEKEKVIKVCNTIKEMGYSNYEIKIVLSIDAEETLEDLKIKNVEVVEGMYSSLHKNISILKWDDEIISEDDELYLFISDDIDIKTNILNRFVSIYLKNKKTFGALFPRILNKNNSIFSTGIDITSVIQGTKANVQCNLKGMNSYYGYSEGFYKEKLGNVGFCLMTTRNNLENYDWFRLDYDNLFYQTDYAAKCTINKKDVFVDNDSVVQLEYNLFDEKEKQSELNKDLNILINNLRSDSKTKSLMKEIDLNKQKQPA
jgi:glycosyltransferase involved in cell wall biosynthesis